MSAIVDRILALLDSGARTPRALAEALGVTTGYLRLVTGRLVRRGVLVAVGETRSRMLMRNDATRNAETTAKMRKDAHTPRALDGTYNSSSYQQKQAAAASSLEEATSVSAFRILVESLVAEVSRLSGLIGALLRGPVVHRDAKPENVPDLERAVDEEMAHRRETAVRLGTKPPGETLRWIIKTELAADEGRRRRALEAADARERSACDAEKRAEEQRMSDERARILAEAREADVVAQRAFLRANSRRHARVAT